MHFLTGVCAIIGGIFTGKILVYICNYLTSRAPFSYVTRSTKVRNKSGHVKSGKSTSKSIGDGFALNC